MPRRYYGWWENPQGYRLTKVYGSKPAVYDVAIGERWPMTYHSPDGVAYRPEGSYVSDMGSLPRFLWPLSDKDDYLLTYLAHDYAYHFHGLYMSLDGDGDFRWQPMSRLEADALMYLTLKAEGCPEWEAWLIYWGVRLGGGRAWRRH